MKNKMIEYKDPYIKVEWEDTPENITLERIKRIKAYFKKKYNTNFVIVFPKIKGDVNDVQLKNVNISENINDFEYQKKLTRDFIKENEINVDWNLLDRLDNRVNNEVNKQNLNKIKYNKWYIKSIEFSNFLSFGSGNIINFENLDGITMVESIPKNFGGKTIMTVDLFLFLFFNTTTRTKTISEIFNLYLDENEVFVKGHIVIDNEEYFVTRKVIRKLAKSGEYNIKSTLEYTKIVDGNVSDLTDEQRKYTENLIRSAIGEQEDFLYTILTTSTNLEDLIEAKPTSRGQILTRFLGLDNIKEKEEICKTFYSDWSKKLISNTYNIQDLKYDIASNEGKIELLGDEILLLKAKLLEKELEVKQIEQQKDEQLSSFSKDIDPELMRLNVSDVNSQILALKTAIGKIKESLSSLVVKEPDIFYDEQKHKKIKEEYNKVYSEKRFSEMMINEKEKTLEDIKKNPNCPICKRPMDNDEHQKDLVSIISDLKTKHILIENNFSEQQKIQGNYEEIEKQYMLYEKNKLIKSKYELEVEQTELKVSNKELLLNKFEQERKKIEKNQQIEINVFSLKSKIETINGEIKTITTSIYNKNTEIGECNRKIESNNELITKIKAEEEFLVIFKTYLAIYGKNGLSKMIIKNMIPVINKELSKLLSDSSYFSVELNINEKNEVEFIMIDNETRKSKLLSTGSGYEKTISSLALRSILSRISPLPKPNIIIMDEVFGKVADENLEMVGNFFLKIKEYFDHIFLISHNSLIKNWSDNVIIINKEENVSKIHSIITKF